MSNLLTAKTIGAQEFGECSDDEDDFKLFRVNAGVPLPDALKHAAHVLYYAKMLSLESAMDPRAERFAFAAHYLCDMGKAILDDLLLAIEPGSRPPQ